MSLPNGVDEMIDLELPQQGLPYNQELMKKVRTFLWRPGPAGAALTLRLSEREQTNLELQLLAFVRGQVDIAWEYGKQRARKLETDARDHEERRRLDQLDEIRQRVMDILAAARDRILRVVGPPAQWTPTMTAAELDVMMAEARAKARPPVGAHEYQPGLTEAQAPTRADVLGPQWPREAKGLTPLPTLDANKDYGPHPDRAYLKPLEKAPVYPIAGASTATEASGSSLLYGGSMHSVDDGEYF